MQPTTAETLKSILAFPAQERRELAAGLVREFVAQDGRDATIQLLFANVFGPWTPLADRQVETLAAFGRLPKETAAALLAPFDPSTIRVGDCLPEDEVERLLTAGSDLRG